MQAEFSLLIISATTIAILHTATGPDHYIPFIALARSRRWSFSKTVFWTVLCGCGHVWSSALLALGGAAIGWSITKISWFSNIRGGLAGWCMFLFGIIYVLIGLYRKQRRVHKHFDADEDGVYVFEHTDSNNNPVQKHKVTPWVMFIIFLLGPCEPMIPLLCFPAIKNSWAAMLLLITVYTICTLVVMLALVLLGYYGLFINGFNKLEKHMHSLAGVAVTLCGAGMLFLRW